MKNKMINKYITKTLFFSLILILSSCSGASLFKLNGGTIDYTKIKTLSIQPILNDAGQGPPTITINATEKLREFYLRNTRLGLVQAGGDMQLEARIVGYEVIPVAPQGGSQVATIQRLQIKIEVTYYNVVNEDQSFEDKIYTQFEDFEQNQTLSQVEEQLVEIILNRIVFDIFNDTAGNW